MVGRFAAQIARLRPWNRVAVAAAMGVLSVSALPPLHWVAVLWIALPVVLWLLDGVCSRCCAFAVGWAYGCGYFAAGLYWVSNALLVDAARFGWLIPFALGGLGIGLGLFFGLLTLGVHLSRVRGVARVVLFASLWTLLEMLRGWVFTGFPWNVLGTVWSQWPTMIQGASLAGVYGLSLATVSIASIPATMGPTTMGWPARGWAFTLGGLVLLGLGGIWGEMRLPPASVVSGVRLRLVQPNIPQADKWNPKLRVANLRRYMTLSLKPAAMPVTHVIWGETALPYVLDGEHDGELRRAVAQGLADTDPTWPVPLLVSGVVRQTPPQHPPFRVWNSLVALDRNGAVRGWYDKAHLVPFGEYVPFRRVLPLTKITAGAVDFTAGSGRVTLPLPGLPPVSPLICYEAIFPGAVVATGRERPRWMLNLTNDGWYGASSEPYQHYATARLRAVEEGIPLVRVANTGISAIVDPWGREIARLEAGVSGVVDGPLPQASDPPLYAMLGNAVPFSFSLVGLAVVMTQRRRLES